MEETLAEVSEGSIDGIFECKTIILGVLLVDADTPGTIAEGPKEETTDGSLEGIERLMVLVGLPDPVEGPTEFSVAGLSDGNGDGLFESKKLSDGEKEG